MLRLCRQEHMTSLLKGNAGSDKVLRSIARRQRPKLIRYLGHKIDPCVLGSEYLEVK